MTFVDFRGLAEFPNLKHPIIPFLGPIGNVGTPLAILVVGLTAGGVSTQATLMALGITIAWVVISAAYVAFATMLAVGLDGLRRVLPAPWAIGEHLHLDTKRRADLRTRPASLIEGLDEPDVD